MNVSLSSRHTVHATDEGSNSLKCHNFGAPHGSEAYRATTREVTCKKCLKALDAEVAEVEVAAPVAEVEVTEVTVHVDMVTPTKGLVTFVGFNLGGTVLNDGQRGGGVGWSAEDEDGDVAGWGYRSLTGAVTRLARSFEVVAPLKIRRHDEYRQTGQTD